jgi:HD-GYP domain-containing protein (c-di-GMP phosphodiesterase class II)
MGLDLGQAQQQLVLEAAPMHDVGKIGIPDYILLKPGKLTPEEFEVMKGHARRSATSCSRTAVRKFMRAGAEVAISHHEKFDGTGYPFGLKGTQIPLLGRIVAVADVFDALTSERPYKRAWSLDDACKLSGRRAGQAFRPAVRRGFPGRLGTGPGNSSALPGRGSSANLNTIVSAGAPPGSPGHNGDDVWLQLSCWTVGRFLSDWGVTRKSTR